MTEATSVVVPAFNEEASIGPLVAGLRGVCGWREILVVDDGSTDATGDRAAAAGARVIRHPYNKGNGAAVKTGIRQASGRYLLIMDADGQHRIADAPRLVSSKIRLAPDGVRFLLILLKVMTIFSPLRIFLPVSAASFLVGIVYAGWTIATQSHVSNSSVLLILTSLVILLVGLVSEQIASLRFEGRQP